MLATELEAYVHRKVATGDYCDPSDVIRHAVRLMQERDSGGCPRPVDQLGRDVDVVERRSLKPLIR